MAKIKTRKRGRNSSVHFTVYSMNGESIPEEVIKGLEQHIDTVVQETTDVRLLSSNTRF